MSSHTVRLYRTDYIEQNKTVGLPLSDLFEFFTFILSSVVQVGRVELQELSVNIISFLVNEKHGQEIIIHSNKSVIMVTLCVCVCVCVYVCVCGVCADWRRGYCGESEVRKKGEVSGERGKRFERGVRECDRERDRYRGKRGERETEREREHHLPMLS